MMKVQKVKTPDILMKGSALPCKWAIILETVWQEIVCGTTQFPSLEKFTATSTSSSHISHTFLSHLDESWQQSWSRRRRRRRSRTTALSLTHEKKASIFTREIIALWKTLHRYTPSKHIIQHQPFSTIKATLMVQHFFFSAWCFAILKWICVFARISTLFFHKVLSEYCEQDLSS